MAEIVAIAGSYKGVGEWFDAAGKSGTYSVVQTNVTAEAGLEVAFHHNFDDGTVTDARIVLDSVAPHIYRVSISDNAVGHGSWLDDTLHYHLEVGGKFVEVGYRMTDNGDLLVSGSSTRNAEGHYTVWVERLRRASSA